ncbi:MAG: DUF4114 domain-containing protein [Gammaproteobacteria bacterium]
MTDRRSGFWKGAVLGMAVGAAALALPAVSDASLVLDQPVLGGTMKVAETGDVTLTYLGGSAAYTQAVYLQDPAGGGGSTLLFAKGQNAVGSTVDVGSFAAGTELTFRMFVYNTGMSYFTGAAADNPDGVAHAKAVTSFDSGLSQYVTTVGFEDLYGGGDRDYNDLMFSLTNVQDPPAGGAGGGAGTGPAQPDPPTVAATVPEPGTLALLGIGLLGLGISKRRRNSARWL